MLHEEVGCDIKDVLKRMKSLEERLALVEGELVALKLGRHEGDCCLEPIDKGIVAKQTPQLNNIRHKQSIGMNDSEIIVGDRTKLLTTLSKIVNPDTKKPYNKLQNKDHHTFGDRVKFKEYTSHRWSRKKKWHEKRGYVVGHTKHFVYIAEDPISEYAIPHKKGNNNVIKV